MIYGKTVLTSIVKSLIIRWIRCRVAACNLLIQLVGPPGLEPGTDGL